MRRWHSRTVVRVTTRHWARSSRCTRAPRPFNNNGRQATPVHPRVWAWDLLRLRCKGGHILRTDRVHNPSHLSPATRVIRRYFQATKQVRISSPDRIALANYQIAPQPYSESASFLHDPLNKIDTSFSTPEYQPFKDNTARQLRHLLVGSLGRFVITLAFCAGYILATRIWVNKDAISENQKKIYNAITTALSLALGLNIASAFKDMALSMRWPILAAKKRNLREVS